MLTVLCFLEVKDRPLLFICHSTGGIVVKQVNIQNQKASQ